MLGSVASYFGELWKNPILMVFAIIAIGYIIGKINFFGIKLGSAAILIVALFFGHFGLKVPKEIQNMGLVLFVAAVGFIAGPKFFRNFKKNAFSYILLGLVIILLGAGSCLIIKYAAGIPTDLALGILVGSLTSTPGLSAAIDATMVNGVASGVVAIGYGIAYPFGVISVVIFVQIMPKLLHTDMNLEREKFTAAAGVELKPLRRRLIKLDPMGLFAFAAAVVVGLFISSIKIPLPGGAEFSLGTTGGPLIAGLLFGHLMHVGPIDIRVNKKILETFRELGLIFFLVGAGVGAGAGFVEVISQYGFALFLYGVPMALIPMIGGYLLARYVFKLNLFNNLGSICGGMTSTPALGTLIQVTGTDDVASAYAATYPIALVAVVLCAQFIGMIP